MIGTAPLLAAQDRSLHRTAVALDTPVGTVRGWDPRARATATQLWRLGVEAVVTLDRDALPTFDRAGQPAAALDALAAVAAASPRRFGPSPGHPGRRS